MSLSNPGKCVGSSSNRLECVQLGVDLVNLARLLAHGRPEGQGDPLDEADEGFTEPSRHAAVDKEVDRRVQHDEQVVDVPWTNVGYKV